MSRELGMARRPYFTPLYPSSSLLFVCVVFWGSDNLRKVGIEWPFFVSLRAIRFWEDWGRFVLRSRSCSVCPRGGKWRTNAVLVGGVARVVGVVARRLNLVWLVRIGVEFVGLALFQFFTHYVHACPRNSERLSPGASALVNLPRCFVVGVSSLCSQSDGGFTRPKEETAPT